MNNYEKYAVIRSRIKDLEKEMEILELAIVEEIKGLSAPMKTKYGTFTTQVRAVWKYSPIVQTKKQELVDLQKKEQEEGTATKEEKLSLRFIEVKDK